jgi:hypothetical protein
MMEPTVGVGLTAHPPQYSGLSGPIPTRNSGRNMSSYVGPSGIDGNNVMNRFGGMSASPVSDIMSSNANMAVGPHVESRVLRFELVSVKGLFIENNDAILKAQLHIIFRGQVLRSNEVAISSLASSDIVFNFNADFLVNDLDFGDIASLQDDECPVMIFLTTSSVIAPNAMHTTEDLPVGIVCSKSLRALAILDCRLAFVHSSSYMSIELMPCEADGFDASGLAAGVLYVHMSVLENDVVQDLVPDNDQAHQGGSGNGIDFANEIIRRYQSKLSLASNENYQRAKTWWLALRKDCPWIDTRDIKMVAHDECGQQRFVCSFVGPIAPLREVNSPREAARMVSLIPFTRNIGIAGGRVNKWKSPFAQLSCMQGDIEDHAILLCSLLLGWGMDAWVAMGSILVPATDDTNNTVTNNENAETNALGGAGQLKKPHCWVVTLDRMSDHKVVFWESLTGQQYDIELDNTKKGKFVKAAEVPATPHGSGVNTTLAHKAMIASKMHDKHPYVEIFALFRHDEYLLNLQRNPSVSTVNNYALSSSRQLTGPMGLGFGSAQLNPFQTISLDISDHRCWVKFPFASSELLRHPGSKMHLSSTIYQTSSFDAVALEQRIENAIKDYIVRSRRDIGLQTKYDDAIALALHPAIVSYELDRSMGATVSHGTADFQCSVRKLVSRGECFKAYPTCFSHVHLPSIIAMISKTSVARDIITARSAAAAPAASGGGLVGMNAITRHGVRAKVFVYPEGLCSVWLVIAVCYFENKK